MLTEVQCINQLHFNIYNNEKTISMIPRDYLKVMAQTHSGWVFDEGIQISHQQVLTVEKNLGLLALSSAEAVEQGSAAHMTLQILVDDMQVNLPGAEESKGESRSAASVCLLESVDNINEYLFNQQSTAGSQKAVSLSAVQFQVGQVSVLTGKGLCVLLFHQGDIIHLGDQSLLPQKLGVSSTFKGDIIEHEVVKDDVVMVLADSYYQAIGDEFLRVTLSRFADNLAMAFRQINTRVAHKGLPQKPALILARIEQNPEKQGGWLNRFSKS